MLFVGKTTQTENLKCENNSVCNTQTEQEYQCKINIAILCITNITKQYTNNIANKYTDIIEISLP